MQNYLEILKKVKFFVGLSDSEILSAIKCLGAIIRDYSKNSTVFLDGGTVDFVGIILLGEVQAQKTDYDGNVNIVSKFYSSDIIAASACYSSGKTSPFDLVCLSDCKILCLDFGRLVRTCNNACTLHLRLIQSMLRTIADKNILLAQKMDILTKRTIKERVLAYLNLQSKGARNKYFSIPLSRRQMSEFLSINRSALSRELSNLKNEGIIDFDNNVFLLRSD